MGAIRESGNGIREKYEAYNKELNKASSELSKVCAICTKPIVKTKDGIKRPCAECGLKKSFDLHMKLYAQALEIQEKLKSI
jgi:hypothetical protein